MTRGTRDESGGGWSKEDYVKLGAEVGAEFKGLSAKFSAEVGTSKTTSHNWSKASYNDFSEVRSHCSRLYSILQHAPLCDAAFGTHLGFVLNQ